MVKKISKALNRQNSLASASIILIITLFISNILGVFRDHFLTQKIPTDILSTYYAAFRIPDFIFNLLILGAIASAFIPVFTTLITQKKNEEAWQVANSIINIAMLVLVIFITTLFITMPFLVPLVVPGFDEEKQRIVTSLARIMLGSPLFFGLSYIVGGILNSHKRFLAYSLAPLIYNVSIIVGAIFFADKYGIVAIAYAVVVGAFLHLMIQLPSAIKLGFRYQPKIYWKHWGVKRIGIMMFPRSIALGANQIMLLIFTAIASGLGGFSVAIYTLADNIQTLPVVVFGTSFATAVFPSLSEAISQNKQTVFVDHLKKTMRIIIFLLIPVTAGLFLLRTEIVRLILGSGFFGWQQTITTANTLGILALSLVFSGLTPLFFRAFYALHNTKLPMVIMLINVIFSIVLGKLFSINMGVLGLALGYAIGDVIGAVIAYALLRRKVTISNEKEIFFFVLKVVLATLIMSIAIQEAKVLSGIFVDMQRFWGVLAKTSIGLGVGISVYSLTCWIFGCEEIQSVKAILNRVIKRGPDGTKI
ncbi:TPA: murein biosynthesis integral membrane protein MurJ [Candidatus Berkelbacteria bacterium]|uniref:Probable lipid II flippase MurJ n=1 Tax=Berkelbacteria bacterium GW2011_GWE1_39_12 TaxID=1618337 RepID=A0A0G4B3H2_9BACT|nr:MAG: integral membrane protein MviN, virulence factor [Berkelbacteria bacterium GW2011_GWE1_39_12]HBO60985.1 murein biosynthesis integral membrane protein MurJ [Candidatus Berkelbacteria bacterium]